jgi:ABC-type nitrate/sulfonate/bicarbonate transport system substrate-binding protein
LASKSDVLTRWLRADIKGWQYCVQNPQQTAQLVWSAYHNETEAVLKNEIQSASVQAPLITKDVAATHGLMWIDEQHFQTVGKLYQQAGLISGNPDYSSVFTQQILVAAGDKA